MPRYKQFSFRPPFAISEPLFECGGIRHLTVYSDTLHGRGDISAFLPADQENSSSTPIVLLLHGVYDSHWAWFFKGGAHLVAKRLIADSDIRPMILVAPSDGLCGDGSAYLAHSGHDYEEWILRDVLGALSKVQPELTRHAPVFVCGLSLGGFGALHLGMKHPRLFRGISAHSAITNLAELAYFTSDPLRQGDLRANDGDLAFWAKGNCEVLPPLRFDCGEHDPLLDGNRALDRMLTDLRIPHHFEKLRGGHDWQYWRENVALSLLFFERILRESEIVDSVAK